MSTSKKYLRIWKRFASDLRGLYEEIGNEVTASPAPNIHSELKAMHWVPYDEIREALKAPEVDGTSDNPGPVTGLFFEQAVSALIVPLIRKRFPAAKIERNSCSIEDVRAIARDPDIFITLDGKSAVMEIKVSPKKVDLEYVLDVRDQYQKCGVGYFFVGGHVTSMAEFIQSFCGETNWACFMDCSTRNEFLLEELPKLDDVVDSLMEFLNNA
jgi:hypothetical protein